MRYKSGTDRMQESFLPSCLDDYVGENHICRVIMAFIECLDMIALGFKYAKPKEAGAKPFAPRMLLSLYIYGYLNRIRSSRRLEREAYRNIEVMWLLERMTPDDKTIANFRRDNAGALKKAFREFTIMLRKMGLYGGELIAVDGTKVKANNSRCYNYNPKNAEFTLSRIDKRIDEYMNALDEADKEEAPETIYSKEKIIKALIQLNAKKKKIEDVKPRLEEPGGVCTVDPDAKLMNQNGDGRALDVRYNVQTAVDEKNKLIVCFDIIDNTSDMGQLKKMSDCAREVLGVEKIKALADKGFYDGEDLVACEKDGIECYVAKPDKSQNKRADNLDPAFAFEHFKYDREKDCYICPMGQELSFRSLQKHKNRKRRYYANSKACRNCPEHSKCCNSPNRQLVREEYQDILDIVDERTKNNPWLYRKRKEIVEHPFGTVKGIWGFRQFLCRTKPKVEAETSLTYIAYNMRRVINIFSGKKMNLITAIRA